MQLDHIGVATDDAAELVDLYETLFDTPLTHEEEFDGMRIAFLDIGGDGYFEVIEPLEEDGAIANYLEDGGPGLHHVALETEDIEVALETVRDHGAECIDEEPRPGAWGHDVAFLHPTSTGGILVELVEH